MKVFWYELAAMLFVSVSLSFADTAQVDSLFENDFYPKAVIISQKTIDINEFVATVSSNNVKLTGEGPDNASSLRFFPIKESKQTTVELTVSVKPNTYYQFSACTKSDSFTASVNPYCYISLRWFDKNGSPIAGRDKLMSRAGGESFWNLKELKAFSPTSASQAKLSLVAGWNGSEPNSSIWFAQTSLNEIALAPIKLNIFPRVLQGWMEKFSINISRTHQTSVTTDCKMEVYLIGSNDKIINQWMSPNLITLPWVIETSLPENNNESYNIRVRLTPIKGAIEQVFEITEPVLVANSNLKKIDNGKFVINGKKRIIIGMYHAEKDDYAIVKQAGINTVIIKSYEPDKAVAALNSISKLGLSAICTIGGGGQTRGNISRIEPVVRAVKDHNALIAWDLMDEPTRKGVGPREIGWYNRWVHSISPDVPTVVNSCGPDTFADFASTVDVFSVDPYPMYTWADYGLDNADFAQVHQWMSLAKENTFSGRGFFGVVECFTFDRQKQPVPDERQLRNMVFQILASGASGVFYYSLREPGWYLPKEPLFEYIKKINDEIVRYEDYFVTKPVSKPGEFVTIDPENPDKIVYSIWKNQNKFLLVIINTDSKQQSISFTKQKDYSELNGKELGTVTKLAPYETAVYQFIKNKEGE
ncbi:MAG: hypothetical protein ACYC54_13920 [Sedimentisphaerales bacterium]